MLGGTAAELGGGKFANGAVTAAFLRLYNDEGELARRRASEKSVEVLIFEPSGSVRSRFGHTATIIDGMAYSWNHDGMKIEPAADYIERNFFRNGIGLRFLMSAEQAQALAKYLSAYQSSNTYNWLTNSCGDPLQRGLRQLGFHLNTVFGGSALTPAGLKFAIISTFPGVTIQTYPAHPKGY